jgi:disulfide bond formation protein DsbB
MENIENTDQPWPVGYLFLAWLGALAGLLGSLYFSEVLHLAPCVLCWWSRIFMYPLVLLLPIGIAFRDKFIYRYTLPLAVAGLLVSIYQNLLYYHVISESLAPCSVGVSCLTRYLHIFGFLDIPQFALLGFLSLSILLIIFRTKIIKSEH